LKRPPTVARLQYMDGTVLDRRNLEMLERHFRQRGSTTFIKKGLREANARSLRFPKPCDR